MKPNLRKPGRRAVLFACGAGAAVAGGYALQVYSGWMPTRLMSERLRWVLPTAAVATAMAWVLIATAWPNPASRGWIARAIRQLAILFACAFVVSAVLITIAGPVF